MILIVYDNLIKISAYEIIFNVYYLLFVVHKKYVRL